MATFKCSHCGMVCSYEPLKSGSASDMKSQNLGCAGLVFMVGMFMVLVFWPVGLFMILVSIIFAFCSNNLRFSCPNCGKGNNVSATGK